MPNSCQWAYECKKYMASFAIRAVVPQHMKLFMEKFGPIEHLDL